MRLYLFKVFSRNSLKMVGILFVFMLISLLIVSPSAISYAERERQTIAQIEGLKNHMILTYLLENRENLSLPEVIDYVTSVLDDIPIIRESLIGFSTEDVKIRLNRTMPFYIAAYYPEEKVGELLDIQVIDGSLDIAPGKILFNTDLYGFVVGGNIGVGSEVVLIGVDGRERRFEVSGLITIPPVGNIFLGSPPVERTYSIISFNDFTDLVGGSMDKFTLDIILKLDPEALKGDQPTVLQTLFNTSQTISDRINEKFNVLSYETVNTLQNVLLMQTFTDIASITLTVFYSFPYIFGIWFLTVVNLELIIRSFRRDIGLIQLRGVPNKVVRRYFLVHLFIIASVGIIAGIIISPYIGNLIIGYLGYEPLSPNVFYSFESIVTAFVLGYILLFIAFHRRAGLLKDISPISVARKYFEPFERSTWSPSTLFLIFFILAVIKMIEWGFAINLNEYITGFGPLSAILIIYSIVSSFMNILAPIIVVYGVINIVIYKTNLISKLTELFSFLFARRFRGIVYRYSGRLPGLISKTTFLSGLLISLMLYYIIFSGRTLYFLDEVSAVNSRAGDAVYLQSSGLDPSKLDELINYVKDALDSKGVEDYLIGVSISGSIKVFQTSIGLNYLYVDDIKDFLEYMGFEDWMLVRYGEDLDILLSRFIVESIENEIGGEIKDVKLSFEIYTLRFFGERRFLVIEDYVDGYIGVGLSFGDIGAFIDKDFFDIRNLNESFDGRLVIFSDSSEKVLYILRDLGLELREYGIISISSIAKYSTGFSLMDMMSFLQKNLYSFNVYAIVAVGIAIILLSVEYVMDMIPDLIVMRSRGLASASKRLAYSLIVPIILFSVVVGVLVGLVAGYGASQQTISTLSNANPNLPLFIDLLAPIYLGVIIMISLVIPLVILGVIHRRYVREVVHLG